MNTLGNTTETVITLEESYSLDKGFTAKAIMPKGTVVNYDPSTGEVGVATVTDAFGVLSIGATAIGDTVTVKTPFVQLQSGIASGAITNGDLLAADGVDGNNVQKFKKAVATNIVVGMALMDSADTAEARVGIYRVFTLMA